MHVRTFSIVAYDPLDQAYGIAVASKFLAVGAVVPWARAGIGAVATQARARVPLGSQGLALMAQGKSAQETLDLLLADDPLREQRQAGMVDSQGRAAAHTGKDCMDWAGHHIGEGFTCQGNILAGAQVVEAMADAYKSTKGELVNRLLAALIAGEDAGGDRRGKQSAAILIVKPNAGYGGDNDRYLDLRVDDDPTPIARMKHLISLHQLYFGEPRPEDQVPIDETLARELQSIMLDTGYSIEQPSGVWDDASRQSFDALISTENLEGRWPGSDPNVVDRVALAYLRDKFGK